MFILHIQASECGRRTLPCARTALTNAHAPHPLECSERTNFFYITL